MKTCHTCRKQLYGEPFRWHGGLEIFCSTDCLPNGVLDEQHAMNYVALLECYREVEEDSMTIETLEKRVDYENEISYLLGQCAEFTLGDSEELFYKVALTRLYDLLLGLHEYVNMYFLEEGHYEPFEGLCIEWDVMEENYSKEGILLAKKLLQSFISTNRIQVELLNGLSLEETYSEYHLLKFDRDGGLERTYEEVLRILHEELLPQKKEDDPLKNGVSLVEFWKCPVCNRFEEINDFSLDEKLKVWRCCYGDVVF